MLLPIRVDAQGAATNAISFSKDIAPILLRKCQTCHGPEKSKGHFQLHTFELLMPAGESKVNPVAPGYPERSKLFQLITARDEDDRMPQKDEPLPAEQVSLLEQWIREGGKFDGEDPKSPLVSLVAQALHPNPADVYPRPVPIMALAFSPNGLELAVGGYNEVTLWNPANAKLLRRIKGLPQQTQNLAYNLDGSVLAAAGGIPGQLGELTLLDPRKGSIKKVLATISDVMLDVRFSPDSQRVAAAGSDNSIRIHNVATGKQELLIQQHADWVTAIAFHRDGSQIASASRDRSARVFDSRTGDLETTYVEHASPVMGIGFTPDGKGVCTAGRDKKIHLWKIKDQKKSEEIGGFEQDILRLITQGEFIFTGSADNSVRQYRISDQKLVRTFSGHTDWVYALAVHEESKRLAAGSFNGEVLIWNLEDGQLLQRFVAAPGWRTAENKTR